MIFDENLFGDRSIKPIKEGPVEIRLKPGKDKMRVTLIIDFKKKEIGSAKASQIMKAIVNVLRVGLDINLSKFK